MGEISLGISPMGIFIAGIPSSGEAQEGSARLETSKAGTAASSERFFPAARQISAAGRSNRRVKTDQANNSRWLDQGGRSGQCALTN